MNERDQDLIGDDGACTGAFYSIPRVALIWPRDGIATFLLCLDYIGG